MKLTLSSILEHLSVQAEKYGDQNKGCINDDWFEGQMIPWMFSNIDKKWTRVFEERRVRNDYKIGSSVVL